MSAEDPKVFSVYNWSTIACSSVLVVCYSASLYLIVKDSKVPFVINIIILMILSNIGAILVIPSNMQLAKDPYPPHEVYWVFI
jgi:hypothetical protein